MIKWVIIVSAEEPRRKTPIGYLPELKDLDLSGLNITKQDLDKLFEFNKEEWKEELVDTRKFLAQFGTHLPREIEEEEGLLAKAVNSL